MRHEMLDMPRQRLFRHAQNRAELGGRGSRVPLNQVKHPEIRLRELIAPQDIVRLRYDVALREEKKLEAPVKLFITQEQRIARYHALAMRGSPTVALTVMEADGSHRNPKFPQ
jgi:hypothetical protein